MTVDLISGASLRLCLDDLTLQPTEAIMNAANSRLLHGGGASVSEHRHARH